MKTTTINNCTLYLADYRDVLPLLGKITAVVADPPYGNDYRQKRSRDKLVKPDTTHAPIVGNAEPFDPAPLLTLAPTVVLWGANYYADRLPANGKWLVWDKRENTTPDDGADVELAWTNLRGVSRMHRQLWRGICRRGEENISRGQRKLHPNRWGYAVCYFWLLCPRRWSVIHYRALLRLIDRLLWSLRRAVLKHYMHIPENTKW